MCCQIARGVKFAARVVQPASSTQVIRRQFFSTAISVLILVVRLCAWTLPDRLCRVGQLSPHLVVPHIADRPATSSKNGAAERSCQSNSTLRSQRTREQAASLLLSHSIQLHSSLVVVLFRWPQAKYLIKTSACVVLLTGIHDAFTPVAAAPPATLALTAAANGDVSVSKKPAPGGMFLTNVKPQPKQRQPVAATAATAATTAIRVR